MAINDIFSKRQKRLRGEPDVFQYDFMPTTLRTQIWQILTTALSGYEAYRETTSVNRFYGGVVSVLRREYGYNRLAGTETTNTFYELEGFFTQTQNYEYCLDVVELVFSGLNTSGRQATFNHGRTAGRVDDAIEELNHRFKQSGVGYQFVDNEIIRVDSELIHAEAVKPAIRLLNTKEYAGPHEEFLAAYQHYRLGNNKEALTDCLKAFESTMKAICDKRGWKYDPAKDTAKRLIEILFANGLIPEFWQTQFTSLRSLLESSVPTGRNKLSGHGQGAVPRAVPDYLTAYMLHMTASTLVFLTTAERELP